MRLLVAMISTPPQAPDTPEVVGSTWFLVRGNSGRLRSNRRSDWSWPRAVDGFGLEIQAAGAC